MLSALHLFAVKISAQFSRNRASSSSIIISHLHIGKISIFQCYPFFIRSFSTFQIRDRIQTECQIEELFCFVVFFFLQIFILITLCLLFFFFFCSLLVQEFRNEPDIII